MFYTWLQSQSPRFDPVIAGYSRLKIPKACYRINALLGFMPLETEGELRAVVKRAHKEWRKVKPRSTRNQKRVVYSVHQKTCRQQFGKNCTPSSVSRLGLSVCSVCGNTIPKSYEVTVMVPFPPLSPFGQDEREADPPFVGVADPITFPSCDKCGTPFHLSVDEPPLWSASCMCSYVEIAEIRDFQLTPKPLAHIEPFVQGLKDFSMTTTVTIEEALVIIYPKWWLDAIDNAYKRLEEEQFFQPPRWERVWRRWNAKHCAPFYSLSDVELSQLETPDGGEV